MATAASGSGDGDNLGFFPTGITPKTDRTDMKFISSGIRNKIPSKVDEGVPAFGPEDLRRMADDALRMQDALIAIQAILKRPPAAGHSLALHHAVIIRDIHKAVNLSPHGYLESFIARQEYERGL